MKSAPKKILVLGTGNAQYDLIDHCKNAGMEVYACSYKKEGRGMEKADHFDVIDIRDSGAVEAHVVANGIDVVYSVGSDIAMPTACRVSENLGLPRFVSSDFAETCNDKIKLRRKLQGLITYSVPYQKITDGSLTQSWTHFPAMVKPADSQGQRGVQRVNNLKEAEDAIGEALKHSPSGQAIIEAFAEGFEVSINLYLHQGEIAFAYISERESFDDLPGGIIKAHHWPTRQPVSRGALIDMCSRVTKLLEISDGPVYLQVKVTPDGNPVIIEVTPRLDGCHIWKLIYETTRVNLLAVTVAHLLGNPPKSRDFEVRNVSSKGRLRFFTAPPHSIFKGGCFTNGEQAEHCEYYYRAGEEIRSINGYLEKTGYEISTEK